MKLKEVFLDIIIGTKLFEMARSRAEAKQLITAQSPQIFEHFVKLFVFNLPDVRAHWIVELNAFFNVINRIYLKPNNKKPDKNTVYTILPSKELLDEKIGDTINYLILLEALLLDASR